METHDQTNIDLEMMKFIDEISSKNLYKYLGLKADATEKDIKKRFNKLSKKYHPDKGGDKKKYTKITEAYTILSNKLYRDRYDALYVIKKQGRYDKDIDPERHQNDFKKFINEQNKNKKELTEQEKKDLMKQNNDFFRNKHNINDEDTTAIEQDVANKKLEELREQRKTVSTTEFFNKDSEVSQVDFNKMFEKMHGSGGVMFSNNDTRIVQAHNDLGEYSGNNFNTVFDNIYTKATNTDQYSSIDQVFSSTIPTGETFEDLQSKMNTLQTSYDEHNKLEDNYDDILKQRLEDYKKNTDDFKSMKATDFKATGDFTISDIGLGITREQKMIQFKKNDDDSDGLSIDSEQDELGNEFEEMFNELNKTNDGDIDFSKV